MHLKILIKVSVMDAPRKIQWHYCIPHYWKIWNSSSKKKYSDEEIKIYQCLIGSLFQVLIALHGTVVVKSIHTFFLQDNFQITCTNGKTCGIGWWLQCRQLWMTCIADQVLREPNNCNFIANDNCENNNNDADNNNWLLLPCETATGRDSGEVTVPHPFRLG